MYVCVYVYVYIICAAILFNVLELNALFFEGWSAGW